MKIMTHIVGWILITVSGCAFSQGGFVDIDITEDIVRPQHYIVTRCTDTIIVDGIDGEVVWHKAPFTKPFIDIEGIKQVKFDTRVKMLWDDDYLYIFAKLEEPDIWGDITQRDAVIFYNNDFEIFIDPSCNTRPYGEIEINALGTVWDLLLDKPYRVGGKAINHWNLDQLKTSVEIYGTLNDPADVDSMWTIEMAIPMKALLELKDQPKSLPEEGELWRINFSRVEWEFELSDGVYFRKKENGRPLPEYNWVWSNQKVINMHEPEKWGYLQFTHLPSSLQVSKKLDPHLQQKQVAFALFRRVRQGAIKKIKHLKAGEFAKIRAFFSDKEYVMVYYMKTKRGFEISFSDHVEGNSYLIDEEGILTIY